MDKVLGPEVTSVETNAAGGKQSRLSTRYDLFPPNAWRIVAEVLHQGAEKYDAWNWLKIPSESHLNHAIAHLSEYLAEQTPGIHPPSAEPHLAHAACRIMMALEMAHREGKLGEGEGVV